MGFFGIGKKKTKPQGGQAASSGAGGATPASVNKPLSKALAAGATAAAVADLSPADLEACALRAAETAVRQAAWQALADHPERSDHRLATIAIQEPSGGAGALLVPLISKRGKLKEVSTKAKADTVRALATTRLAEMVAADAGPSAEQRRQARLGALAAVAEAARVVAVASDPLAVDQQIADLTLQRDQALADAGDVAVDAPAEEHLATIDRLLATARERAAAAESALAVRQALLDAGAPEADDQAAAWQAQWDATEQVPGARGAEQAAAFAAAVAALAAPPVDTAEASTDTLDAEATATAVVTPEIDEAAVAAVLDEANALADEGDNWRDSEQRFMVLDKTIRNLVDGSQAPQRQAFVDAFRRFKDRRRAAREAAGAEREKQAELFAALVTEAEQLAAAPADDIDARRNAVKALQAKAKGFGGRHHELRQRFRQATDLAWEPVRAADEARDWERFANVPKAEALIDEVAVLAAEDGPEPGADLLAAVKDAQQRWRAVGGLPRDRYSDLRDQFSKTCDAVFARLQPWFDERDQQRVAAGDERERLLGELNALADDTAPIGVAGSPADRDAWKQRMERLDAIRTAWKAAGPAPRELEQPQWDRYKAALDRFHGARRAAHAAADEERAGNLDRKLGLLISVEELAEDAEAFRAGKPVGSKREPDFLKQVRDLQRTWREAGPVPRERAPEVNERFKAACDKVFAVLEPWFAAQDEERQAHLADKQALLKELEELLEEERPDWFADEVHAIRKRWRDVGPVPRDAREIEDRFRALCDQILGARR